MSGGKDEPHDGAGGYNGLDRFFSAKPEPHVNTFPTNMNHVISD